MAGLFKKIVKTVGMGIGSVMSLVSPAAGNAIVTLSQSINTSPKLDKVAAKASQLVTGQTVEQQNAILKAQNETAWAIKQGAASASVLASSPTKIIMIVVGVLVGGFLLFKFAKKR